jgi:hypothetical protein
MLAAAGASALPALPVAPVTVPEWSPTILHDNLVWERHFWDEVTQQFLPEAEYNAIEKMWYNGIVWC